MSASQFREGLQNFVEEQVRIEPASGGRTSGYEPLPDTLNGPRDDMICQILKDCLARVGGPCDPSRLRSLEWKLLDRFVEPGKLRAFIEERPEFVIVKNSCNKGWTFGWSPEFTPGGSSSHDAPNAQATMANATSDIESGQSALASGRIPFPPGLGEVASLIWLGPDIEVQSTMRVKTPGYTAEALGYISVKEDERVIIKCPPACCDAGFRFSSYVYVRLASAPTEGGGWMPVDLLEE